jgi:hypothetical protein
MRHAFEKHEKGKGWVFDEAKARREFQDTYIDSGGVLRWKSNDHVPPEDCMEDFRLVGCEFDIELARATREREDAEFLAEYRRNQKPPTNEELFEMRAAFGGGTTVVNVITGRKTKL